MPRSLWLMRAAALVAAVLFVHGFLHLTAVAAEPKLELLWPEGAPGAVGTEDNDKPSLTIWLPGKHRNTRTAVVLCPGGGYGGLAVDHEGKQIAEFFGKHGVATFMLKYRLAPKYKHPTPMLDVQRALRMVRTRAKEFEIEPTRIGVMGFSAGGHLASTAATHFDDGKADAADPFDRTSCRPDFAISIYPGHLWIDREKFALNPAVPVTNKTPPTFLLQCQDDMVDPPEHSLVYYRALKKAGVPVEMHLYAKGGHAFGLRRTDKAVTAWPELVETWLAGLNFN